MHNQKGMATLVGAGLLALSMVVGMISEHYFEKENNPVKKVVSCIVKQLRQDGDAKKSD